MTSNDAYAKRWRLARKLFFEMGDMQAYTTMLALECLSEEELDNEKRSAKSLAEGLIQHHKNVKELGPY